jgi:hypothetical protein
MMNEQRTVTNNEVKNVIENNQAQDYEQSSSANIQDNMNEIEENY